VPEVEDVDVLADLHHEPHVVLDEEDRQLALVAQPRMSPRARRPPRG
jgi:hypothetical protein